MLSPEEMTEFLDLFERSYHVRKDSVTILDATDQRLLVVARLLDNRLQFVEFTRGGDTVLALSLNAEEKLREYIHHADSA
jgi:hypothetical protein